MCVVQITDYHKQIAYYIVIGFLVNKTPFIASLSLSPSLSLSLYAYLF